MWLIIRACVIKGRLIKSGLGLLGVKSRGLHLTLAHRVGRNQSYTKQARQPKKQGRACFPIEILAP